MNLRSEFQFVQSGAARFVALLLLMVLFPGAARAQLSDIQYTTTTSNNQITITGFSATGSGPLSIPATLVDPATHNSLPVVAINTVAFANNTNLTNVTIPASVTNIGDYAFSGCTSVTSFTVSAQNTVYVSVGGVLFDKNQTILMQYPLGNTSTSYTVPSSVTTINGDAFAGCAGLTSVTIPSSVTNIISFAFDDCVNLTSINVDAQNPSYSSLDGVLFDKNQTILFQYPSGKADASYTIPDSVTIIDDDAFQQNTKLASVTFGHGLTSTGIFAFYQCTGLTTVTIPANITTIDYGSFWGCASLNNVTLPANLTSISEHAFRECTSLTYIAVPGTVSDLAQDAFEGCTSLVTATLGEGIMIIEDGVFQNCTSLTSISIPDSVSYLGNDVFYGCTSLTSVTLGKGLTEISFYMFYGCTSLAQITIPANIITIWDDAFQGCSSLVNVTFLGDAPEIGLDVFDGVADGFHLSYYDGAAGFTSPTWTDYANDTFATVNLGSLPSIPASTDTPTLPPWAMVALALLLFAVASKALPQHAIKHSVVRLPTAG